LSILDDPESSNISKLLSSHKHRKVTKENSTTTLKRHTLNLRRFLLYLPRSRCGEIIEKSRKGSESSKRKKLSEFPLRGHLSLCRGKV